MKNKETQKGNPYQLTIKQHNFPRASILRFANNNKLVNVYHKSQNKALFVEANNALFCAKRCWDERAESGYMKTIEDDFQKIAEKIIKKEVLEFSETETVAISRFYALWTIRSEYKESMPSDDIRLYDIPGESLTKNEREILESKHCSYVNIDGIVPARFIYGLQIQKIVDYCKIQKWGIIYADDGEFIVPDFPNESIIPILPNLCLVANANNGTVLKQTVIDINRCTINASKNYYFARDISKCPF